MIEDLGRAVEVMLGACPSLVNQRHGETIEGIPEPVFLDL